MFGLNLETALAQWRLWSGGGRLAVAPDVVRPPPEGLTNQSFLLRAGERQLVLRLNSPDSAALGTPTAGGGTGIGHRAPGGALLAQYRTAGGGGY